MQAISDELRRQVEAAYDYRGHVTLRLKDGSSLEGFIYNREFENPLAAEQFYADLFVKDSDVRKRLPLSEIAAIELTGKDWAAGNSYEDYLKKKAAQAQGA